MWRKVKPRVKYQMIYHHREKYSIQRMCTFFEVSRSGYYIWLKRKDTPNRDSVLVGWINECQQRCRQTYGYRRVALWLQRYKGVYYNPKTVLRVMNKYGLLSHVRRKNKYRQMGDSLHRYENHLNRQFSTHASNRKWVTDISYIQTGEGTLYLSIIRDLYDNSIVAYRLAKQQTAQLVLDTIRLAMDNTKAAGELLLHSDQGLQYTSHAYFSLTKEYGITPSMSRRGNCYDNAMAENFFSILKTECIYPAKPESFFEAEILIDDFIHFYNYERIQLKTGLAPLELRRQHA